MIFLDNLFLIPMKKTILLLLLLSILSCQKQQVADKKANDTVAVNAKLNGDYVGTYKGILPCADCQGLITELAINENSTFCLKTRYDGKGDKVFMHKGHFTWNKKGDIIILTDIQNGPNQYLVGKNMLTQLSMSGKVTKGNFADDYILSKQPTDTSNIDTAEETNPTTVDLNSRISATTTIKKVNPAVGKYTLAETKWKLISLNKKKVSQNGKKEYFIKLNSKDGRFEAFAGCNSIWGSYDMPSFDTLSFSETITTEMACTNMDLETGFTTMLSEVNSYKIQQGMLTLLGKGKKTLAQFQAI